MNQYLKVMFGTTSGADKHFQYKLNEVNIASNWDHTQINNPAKMGGFNFANKSSLLRYLIRGDILYDVVIPKDAEVIECHTKSCPTGIFRTNKIIITNPRPMTDELAMELYLLSDLPEQSYYKSLAGLMVRGYEKTCLRLICDKVNLDNINLVLSEIEDFSNADINENDNKEKYPTYFKILEILKEIQNPLLINQIIDRPPYIKKLTEDKVINLTGESGAGKTHYSKQWQNDDRYIIIDTDAIYKDNADSYNKKIHDYLIQKYNGTLPNNCTNFEQLYLDILDFFKDSDKTIVIDSAQFRNIQDITKLKGNLIVIRTSINKCYQQCLYRYNQKSPHASEQEKAQYANRKKAIYSWYKSLNNFLIKLDKL